MNHFSMELAIFAVIPALALCGYVVYMDRIEREPAGLLAILFGAGALSYIPVHFIQKALVALFDGVFADKMSFSAEGVLSFNSYGTEITHLALCSFIGFSLVRICISWLLLFFVTRKNKHFNYLFDGIVYSIFISLGFTVVENIHFFMQNDIEMLLPKLFTSIPCNLFIGILMGYYHTMWHMRFVANGIEEDMLKAGVVKEDKVRSSAIWLICSFIVPFLVNGIYCMAGAVKNDVVTLIFYYSVFFVFGISFLAVNKMALRDAAYGRYLFRIIAKGHPDLSPETIKTFINDELDGEARDIKE